MLTEGLTQPKSDHSVLSISLKRNMGEKSHFFMKSFRWEDIGRGTGVALGLPHGYISISLFIGIGWCSKSKIKTLTIKSNDSLYFS